jgi:hypothetical protein
LLQLSLISSAVGTDTGKKIATAAAWSYDVPERTSLMAMIAFLVG